MAQEDTCYRSHSSFRDLLTCSGKNDGIVYHQPFDWNARDWTEFERGFETCAVMSTEIDPSAAPFVAGYAVRFNGKSIKKRKKVVGGVEFKLVDKQKMLQRLFATRGLAVKAAKANVEATCDKYEALTSEPFVSPLLGDPELRREVARAYEAGALSGDLSNYERLRAQLPRQPLPEV